MTSDHDRAGPNVRGRGDEARSAEGVRHVPSSRADADRERHLSGNRRL